MDIGAFDIGTVVLATQNYDRPDPANRFDNSVEFGSVNLDILRAGPPSPENREVTK